MQPAFDLDRVASFEWDEGNARKSEERHGVSQAEAEQVFACDLLLIDRDVPHSQLERRYNALGRTCNGRLLPITLNLRSNDTATRIISAREVNRKERNRFAQET